jgi:TolB-like protein
MSLFAELKRRNVFRVGIAYLVLAWVLLQVTDVVVPILELPDWVARFVLFALLIGFPVILVFAWAFELTADGVRREKDVDRGSSMAALTGRRLDRAIIGILVVALGWFVWDRFARVEPAADVPAQAAPVEQPAAVKADQRTVAVLPFTTRSTSEEDRFFSDGMHDDLLTQLAKIGSLKVISRTSVMEYRNTTRNLREIGRELGAGSVLEGAVQRAGSQVRINVQLIDAESDEHLWAETYDRALSIENLLSIQSEIARAIAGALQATLSPTEEARLDRQLTGNLEALEAYRRARVLSQFFIDDDLERAEDQVRHALELDPGFAAAWAELAYVKLAQWWGVEQREEFRAAARQAIDRGRAIDPGLLELDIAEGYYHYWGFLDYPRALAVLEPRLAEFPNHAELLQVTAFVNRRYGRVDQTLNLLLRASPLAPRDLSLHYSIGETYAWLRRWDEAQRYLDIIEALDPTHTRSYQLRADILAGRDADFDGAARYMGLASEDTPHRVFQQWEYLLCASDREGALALAEQVERLESSSIPAGMLRGQTLAYFGALEAARPLLQSARERLSADLEEQPGDHDLQHALCDVTGALGDTAAALQYCEVSLATEPQDAMSGPFERFRIAASLGAGGALDRALEILLPLGDSRVGPARNWIEADLRLRDLHGRPEWRRLMNDLEPAP